MMTMKRGTGMLVGAAAGLLLATTAFAHRVTVTRLNVRRGPGTGYAIKTWLAKGAIVRWTSVSGSWLKIPAVRPYSALFERTIASCTDSTGAITRIGTNNSS